MNTSTSTIQMNPAKILNNREKKVPPISSQQHLTQRQLGRRRRRQRRRQRKREQRRLQQEHKLVLPSHLIPTGAHNRLVTWRRPTSPPHHRRRSNRPDSNSTVSPEFLFETWSQSEFESYESEKVDPKQHCKQELLTELDQMGQYHNYLIYQHDCDNQDVSMLTQDINDRLKNLDIDMDDNHSHR